MRILADLYYDGFHFKEVFTDMDQCVQYFRIALTLPTLVYVVLQSGLDRCIIWHDGKEYRCTLYKLEVRRQ